MAHILEFSVSGLAGRSDTFACKLNRTVNIFFGLNGCGKTSLLKILHSAMWDDASLLRSVPFRRAEVKIFSVQAGAEVVRTIEQTTGGTGRDLLQVEMPDFADRVVGSEVAARKRLHWTTEPSPAPGHVGRYYHKYLPTARLFIGAQAAYAEWMAMSRASESHEGSEQHLDMLFARTLQSLWASYSADVLGNVRRAQQAGLASILYRILTSEGTASDSEELEPAKAYRSVETFLARQGYKKALREEVFARKYADDGNLRSVVLDINKGESEIQRAMAPRDQLQSLIREMFSGNKSVVFSDATLDVAVAGGSRIGLESLSSGEKQLLRILIDTLTVAESCIVVDEPEISMHVDWQRRLISTMRQLNAAAQLVIATHSPEIMADAEDSQIFRL